MAVHLKITPANGRAMIKSYPTFPFSFAFIEWGLYATTRSIHFNRPCVIVLIALVYERRHRRRQECRAPEHNQTMHPIRPTSSSAIRFFLLPPLPPLLPYPAISWIARQLKSWFFGKTELVFFQGTSTCVGVVLMKEAKPIFTSAVGTEVIFEKSSEE